MFYSPQSFIPLMPWQFTTDYNLYLLESHVIHIYIFYLFIVTFKCCVISGNELLPYLIAAINNPFFTPSLSLDGNKMLNFLLFQRKDKTTASSIRKTFLWWRNSTCSCPFDAFCVFFPILLMLFLTTGKCAFKHHKASNFHIVYTHSHFCSYVFGMHVTISQVCHYQCHRGTDSLGDGVLVFKWRGG